MRSEGGVPTLREKLPKLSDDAFLFMNVAVGEVLKADVETLKTLQSAGYGGVFVSLSKDYPSIVTALGQAGLDVRRLKFVDAISRMYGIAPADSPDVVYVDGPLSVDAIIDGIAASLHAMKGGKRFVLLDSLTTILLYNSLERTVAFSKALRKLLKKERAAGIVMVAYRASFNEELLRKMKKSGGEEVSP